MQIDANISSKLNSLGFTEEEAGKVYSEISILSILRFVENSFGFSDAEKESFKSMSLVELEKILTNKIEGLSDNDKTSMIDKFKSISDQTWDEYFKYMRK